MDSVSRGFMFLSIIAFMLFIFILGMAAQANVYFNDIEHYGKITINDVVYSVEEIK